MGSMWSCKRCRSPVGTANAKSCCGRQGMTTSDRRIVVIAVTTKPALDAGSRPATEARADSEPPAMPAAFSLRCRTKVLHGGAVSTLHGWRSWDRYLQRRVVLLKPYRGRHPGPGQRKERLAVFAVVSRFRPGKALVRVNAHLLWGHDAISFG